MQLAQAEKDFQKLKEMFPEEEKVPLRLQDLYSVLRSSGVQIQKFNPEGRSEREHYIENRYSIAVNSGYHMLGYLFAEIANFNYPTAITNLRLSRYSGIAAEVQKAESHGWTPITMSVNDSDIADGNHSVILDQVTNGVAVRMAVLFLLAGGRNNENA